jgi:nucleotide-binding universal stress UspA family protein
MKILIPLDGSKFAEAVLKPAAALAAAARAEVHLIEVVRPSETKDVWPEVPSSNPKLYRAAEKYLNGIGQQFFPDGATSKIVINEYPAKEILDYARREKVDLIAIATHGRTGLARIMLGSVAGELLKAHVAPIFMVRPEGLF